MTRDMLNVLPGGMGDPPRKADDKPTASGEAPVLPERGKDGAQLHRKSLEEK